MVEKIPLMALCGIRKHMEATVLVETELLSSLSQLTMMRRYIKENTGTVFPLRIVRVYCLMTSFRYLHMHLRKFDSSRFGNIIMLKRNPQI